MAQLIEFPIKAATRAGNALVQPLRSAWPVHSVDDYGRDPHLISALAPLAKLRWDLSRVMDKSDALLVVDLCPTCARNVVSRNHVEGWDEQPATFRIIGPSDDGAGQAPLAGDDDDSQNT